MVARGSLGGKLSIQCVYGFLILIVSAILLPSTEPGALQCKDIVLPILENKLSAFYQSRGHPYYLEVATDKTGKECDI